MTPENQQLIVMLSSPLATIFVCWFSFADSLAVFQNSSDGIAKKSLRLLFNNMRLFTPVVFFGFIAHLIPVIGWFLSGMPKESLSWSYAYHVVISLIFAVFFPFLYFKKFNEFERK